MKNTLFILSLLVTSMSCSQTVQIGTQVWMTKNLDVATFRNGDPIPEVKTDEEWKQAGKNKQPAWCYYNNDPANGTKYGKLYNWYAVNDPRGLAPEGYHIPSDAEWTMLLNFLGSNNNKKMKSTSGWLERSTGGWLEGGNGTNESGFSGLPGGCRTYNGKFVDIGYDTKWWSSTLNEFDKVWDCRQSDAYGNFGKGDSNKEDGRSLRCIKD